MKTVTYSKNKVSAAKAATESEVYNMTIEGILSGESKNVEFKENLPEKALNI